MSSVYSYDDIDMFYIRQNKLINDMKCSEHFHNSVNVATNLGFDFFGTFYQLDDIKEFMILLRGSQLIYAKSYIDNNKFNYKSQNKHKKSIKFLDTMNYIPMGVKAIGEFLKIPKLDVNEIIGQVPKNANECYFMMIYNMRDAKISSKFMIFLKESFEYLGATFKDTIASTSMSLYKNKYLKSIYFRHDINDLIDIFKAYYGGRCEVFKRGTIKEHNYYDFNSMYSSVMHDNVFPDPNTHRISYDNTIEKIMNYEGISLIDAECPNIKIPILPVRLENKKVIFPIGDIKGWYSHIELREAIKNGLIIMKVNKTHYYKGVCKPFKDFVSDLYSKRMIYQAEKNPMEMVVKLLLNSLYGKFGQKFIDIQNIMPINMIDEAFLEKYTIIERIGNFVRISERYSDPMNYCIPIWAVYVTAYGRLKLWNKLNEINPVYCDTDSIITNHDLVTNNKLGNLKLEMRIKEAVIVKPKFYAIKGFKNNDNIEEIKIKGFSRAVSFLEISGEELKLHGRKKKFLSYLEFKGFLLNPNARYNKFVKFKEALRRHLLPNEDIIVKKSFSINDDKRIWTSKKFNINNLEDSRPIMIKME